MKHYEVQVAANLTRWYDIEAESEDAARKIADRLLVSEIICEYSGDGGEWFRMDDVIEQIIKKEG